MTAPQNGHNHVRQAAGPLDAAVVDQPRCCARSLRENCHVSTCAKTRAPFLVLHDVLVLQPIQLGCLVGQLQMPVVPADASDEEVYSGVLWLLLVLGLKVRIQMRGVQMASVQVAENCGPTIPLICSEPDIA